ncbi:MAG: hypothetical protein ACI9QN_001527 [Arcticibacterium sp.]|jgi:hypothetical protein
MVASSDFRPTFLDAIGGKLPANFITDEERFLTELIIQKSGTNHRDWIMIDQTLDQEGIKDI